MSDKRIVNVDNRFYPEYYKERYFFNLLGGYWKRYRTEELWVNGYFTELVPCDVSYSNLEMAKDFFKESEIKIIEL